MCVISTVTYSNSTVCVAETSQALNRVIDSMTIYACMGGARAYTSGNSP